MTEIVINRCPRGTLLSDAGKAELAKRHGGTLPDPIDQSDPNLIAMMKENRDLYMGHCARVEIINVADDAKWRVKNKGNFQWVALDA